MTPELTALAAAVLVQFCALTAYALVGNLQLGPRVTLSNRDHLPELSPLLGRLQRNVVNGVEGLAMFTPAVVVVSLSGHSSALTAVCAWAYVAARAAYGIAYGFGLVPWRSIIWSLGLLANLGLLAAAFLPAP